MRAKGEDGSPQAAQPEYGGQYIVVPGGCSNAKLPPLGEESDRFRQVLSITL